MSSIQEHKLYREGDRLAAYVGVSVFGIAPLVLFFSTGDLFLSVIAAAGALLIIPMLWTPVRFHGCILTVRQGRLVLSRADKILADVPIAQVTSINLDKNFSIGKLVIHTASDHEPIRIPLLSGLKETSSLCDFLLQTCPNVSFIGKEAPNYRFKRWAYVPIGALCVGIGVTTLVVSYFADQSQAWPVLVAAGAMILVGVGFGSFLVAITWPSQHDKVLPYEERLPRETLWIVLRFGRSVTPGTRFAYPRKYREFNLNLQVKVAWFVVAIMGGLSLSGAIVVVRESKTLNVLPLII